MKKKYLAFFVTMAMTAALVGGCGTTEEAAEEPTEEIAEEAAEEEPEETEEEDITEAESEETAEEEAAEETEETEEETAEESEFAVEELADTIMYAKQSVNVRRGPSTDYEQIGSLSWAQEVTVTGIADTGWYRIKYNDETGFCSNNYLATTKPESTSTASSSAGSSSSGSSGSTSSSDKTLLEQISDALDAGDTDLFYELEAQLYAKYGVETENGIPTTYVDGSSATSSLAINGTYTSTSFADVVNSGRSANGLGTLTWDDGLASTACERAEEIVSDFSHNGWRNCAGEIILLSSSRDPSAWYESFCNSSDHYNMMMKSSHTRIGAAYCDYSGAYYVVCLFK